MIFVGATVVGATIVSATVLNLWLIWWHHRMAGEIRARLEHEHEMLTRIEDERAMLAQLEAKAQAKLGSASDWMH